jgi:Rrf2 family protein
MVRDTIISIARPPMKVNTRVRYAIRMMADIARHGAGEPVPLSDVAERQGLSRLYLSQLATALRNASLLRSVWGNRGGYVLARPASEIRLLDIMEAAGGPVTIIECVRDPELCDRSARCEAIGVWRDINEAILRVLERYTLQDLIRRRPRKPAAAPLPVTGRRANC